MFDLQEQLGQENEDLFKEHSELKGLLSLYMATGEVGKEDNPYKLCWSSRPDSVVLPSQSFRLRQFPNLSVHVEGLQ